MKRSASLLLSLFFASLVKTKTPENFFELFNSDFWYSREADNNHISFCRVVGSAVKGDIFKHIGIYAYHVRDLKGYIQLKQSSNEKDLSLEQYRFLDNNFNISPYLAVSDPGISVDSIDNINDINGVNI